MICLDSVIRLMERSRFERRGEIAARARQTSKAEMSHDSCARDAPRLDAA